MANTSGRNAGSGASSDSGNVVTEQVRQGTQQVVQSAQQAVGQVTEQATQQAQSVLARQKGQATDTLHQVSDALRQTGQTLAQQQNGAAGLLTTTASRLDDVSGYLEQRNLGELVNEAESLARRNSAIFLGAAFALGVLAARFLKSSAPSRPSHGSQYGGGQHTGNFGRQDSYDPYYTQGYTPGYTAESSPTYSEGYPSPRETGAGSSRDAGDISGVSDGTTG